MQNQLRVFVIMTGTCFCVGAIVAVLTRGAWMLVGRYGRRVAPEPHPTRGWHEADPSVA